MLYLTWSVRVLSQPVKVLLSAEYKEKYESLYADLHGSAYALSITLIHNVRLLVLIFSLVFGSPRPLLQSIIFTASSAISLSLDTILKPYDGLLLTAQTFFMRVLTLIGSIGYIVFTIPGVSAELVDRLCTYEAVVLALAMGGGLVLAVAQQAIAVYAWVKGVFEGKNPDAVYVITSTDRSRVVPDNSPTPDHQQIGSSGSSLSSSIVK